MRNESVYNYTVYYQPLAEGGYNVLVPAMPEICTFGETLKEAKRNAQEAIGCVLESTLLRKEHIPLDNEEIQLIKERVSIPLSGQHAHA